MPDFSLGTLASHHRDRISREKRVLLQVSGTEGTIDVDSGARRRSHGGAIQKQ
jgi:hypothetical protein